MILSLGVAAIMSVARDRFVRGETCNSPYMSGLIKGQEDFVHVWTLGVRAWAMDRNKLVSLMRIRLKTYGR